MKRIFAVSALLFGLVAVAQATQDDPLVPAQECHARRGLPHFFAKARMPGAAVKIAYLGGSITAQPGWRPKTLAYFQKTYPMATFSEINAAIGGTGSDLGVFRLKRDVLDKNPTYFSSNLRSTMAARRPNRSSVVWKASCGRQGKP